MPDRNKYLLTSTNYKSDEVLIRNTTKIGEVSKMIWYTIGILGITDTCKYTLMAIENGFQVLDFVYGKILYTKLTPQTPLVLRESKSYGTNNKIFYYSFDTGIELRMVKEEDAGIIVTVNDHLSKANPIAKETTRGSIGIHNLTLYNFSKQNQPQ